MDFVKKQREGRTMKQLVVSYETLRDEKSMAAKLEALRRERPFFRGYVQVFSELLDEKIILDSDGSSYGVITGGMWSE